MTSTEIRKTLAPELAQYVSDQNSESYTEEDHASWRYIMKVSQFFLKDKAHVKYLKGLEATGISIERIPLISEMDEKLQKFGWRAVPVSGFIPPATFMEFQATGILPIACDMRSFDHISYTPAPDIVHEASGHAPILADPDYAAFLKRAGEIAKKAIYTQEDIDVYHAIRHLSETKENPKSTSEEIKASEKKLEKTISLNTTVSEATEVARLFWWSVEYGLIGELEAPKIYGAGLLSSVGESYRCLSKKVKKLPFTMKCTQVTYDITKPQPQLFVAKSFKEVVRVFNEYAKTMAYKKGGVYALEKAKLSRFVTTTVLDSGIQISGKLENFKIKNKKPIYIQIKGPSQLCYENLEIKNQGPHYHQEGFGSPLGILKDLKMSPADLTDKQLDALGFHKNKKGKLIFESGVAIEGVLKKTFEKDGKKLILTFDECKVTFEEEVLFDPSWGPYDMVCGEKVISCFGGAADRTSFLKATDGFMTPKTSHISNFDEKKQDIYNAFKKIREWRQSNQIEISQIKTLIESIKKPTWLLLLEAWELVQKRDPNHSFTTELYTLLQSEMKYSEHKELIQRGIQMILENKGEQ
tara:strand:- start:992 stop:2737 length:1746 start_codon:yes stop_codon:yes gene_type:complete